MAQVTTRDPEEPRLLMAAFTSYMNEIARQRSRLRSSWMTASQRIERLEQQLRVVSYEHLRRGEVLSEIARQYNVPDRPGSGSAPPATVDAFLVPGTGAQWALRPEIAKQFEGEAATARQRFQTAKAKTFGGSLMRAGSETLGRYALRLRQLGDLKPILERELRDAIAGRAEAARGDRSQADQALGPTESLARHSVDRLPAILRPWTSQAWANWRSEGTSLGLSEVYAGSLQPLDDPDLGDNASFGSAARLPFFLSIRNNLEILYNNGTRDRTLSFARSLLLRTMAAANPGELQLSIYDPAGLGQSAADLLGLAEYDANLIGGKVWSSPADLSVRLAELTSHVELVIQKYLQASYQTIDEFNEAAGEIAEPYRLLVLFDFPTGLTDETMWRLQGILQNGPRCGVHTLLLTNSAVPGGFGVNPGAVTGHVRRIDLSANFASMLHGYNLQMRLMPELDTVAGGPVARTIIDTIGRRSVGRTESAVTFEKVFGLFSDVARRGIRTDLSQAAASAKVGDESTWWRDNSTRGLFAPIGQKGARDAAILSFDSSDHAGALLVGRPGSGKSTLLHAYLGGLTTLYGPHELELYLIDFKEGVEFKSYAAEALPHARVVAIESDRDFGLSVLQSLKAELTRRGELLRSTGGRHAGLQALREASGESLPRVLLIFDEFQVLFARNDKVGLAAADLLETIIRQGRGFGVHVLLGSQSLSGLDALGSHVPQLLPVRILLPASELDARRVLGDNNDAGQYLTSHGEGVLNNAGGAVEANERFKGSLLTEPDRIERLRRLRAKADREGFHRRPLVFEGNAAIPLDGIQASQFREELAASGTSPIRLRIGAPMAISGVADAALRREAGANLLAIMRDGEPGGPGLEPSGGPAYGLLTAAVASAAQSSAKIDVIDFMSIDDGLDAVLEPFLDTGRITLRRARAFSRLVEDLAEEVRDRVEQDDALRPARLAFLFGVHRARELDAEIGGMDADLEVSDALERIMLDGPEVGVHLWLWSDTVGGATRRLTSRMIRGCSWRIAGKMSPDDSSAFIGTEQAAEIRDRQLVLNNDDLGISARAMTFGLPSAAWLCSVAGHAPDSHPYG